MDKYKENGILFSKICQNFTKMSTKIAVYESYTTKRRDFY